MDTKRARLRITRNGVTSEYIPVALPTNGNKPVAVSTPLYGFFVYAESGPAYRPARVRWNAISRTFDNKSGLRQTNATFPMNGAPDYRSKVITQLQNDWRWVEQFRSMIGVFMWGLYVQPGAGFQDTNTDPTDPDVGPFKQQSLTCSGNLLSTCADTIWTNDGAYVTVAIQDFNQEPNPLLTYERAPHMVTKQTLEGHNADKETYRIVHKRNGDMVFPMVCRVPLAIALRNIEYLPVLPFTTTMNGYEMTFDAFCFQGSNTLGQSRGEWYLIEEMVVSGIGACKYDRRVYVRDWIVTCPPPVIGFRRTGQTFWEKVLGLFGIR